MTLILRVWKFEAKSRQRLGLVESEFTILGMRPFPVKVAELFPNHGVAKRGMQVLLYMLHVWHAYVLFQSLR
jgi:hypothetical protein